MKYSPATATSYEAHVAGQYYNGEFNLAGGGKGCVLGWCEGGHGVISSKGIGVCIEVSVDLLLGTVSWSPGFSVTYHPFDLDLFGYGCDLSSGDGDDRAADPAAERVLRGALTGDLPMYAHAAGFAKSSRSRTHPGRRVHARRLGGAAQVTLKGPQGRTIDGTPGGLVVKKKDYSLLHDPQAKTTYVVVLGPPKGKWTLSVPDSSSPVVSAKLTPGLPEPTINASVKSSRGKYKLDYKVLDQPGLKVEFAERSGRSFSSLATVKPGVGSIPFTPAAGPKGSRKIVAILYSGGRPRSEQTVTTYTAPAPTGPEDVRGVKVEIKGGKATVTWDKAARANRYLVAVSLSDGRVVRASVKKTSFTVTGLDRGVDATATVQAFDATGLRGDSDKDKATTPNLPKTLKLPSPGAVTEIAKKGPVPEPGLTLLASTKVPLP